MDTVIWVHFFEVAKRTEASTEFSDALEAVWALGATPGEREIALSSDDTVIRLERYSEQGDWIEGEVVRVQRANIPPEAFPEGLQASSAGSQGHSMVFRYHKQLRVLAAEKNRVGMTVSRFLRYLKANEPMARYIAPPVASNDMWERFAHRKVTRFSVGLSALEDPSHVGGIAGALSRTSKDLHDMTHAPAVHFTMHAGGLEDGLEKGAIRSAIENLLGGAAEREVTSLSVSTEDESDRGNEAINFLDDVLKRRHEIDVSDLDSDGSYEERMEFLRDCFAENIDYLEGYYGMGA